MSTEHYPGYEIPNGEHLFRFFNPQIIPPGQTSIPLAIFNDTELSCDWEYYRSNPFDSFHIEEGCSRVIQITVCDEIKNIRNPLRIGEIVEAWHQNIIYNPVSKEQDEKHGENLAHSLIVGKKKGPVQKALQEHSKEVFKEDFVDIDLSLKHKNKDDNIGLMILKKIGQLIVRCIKH